LEIADRAAPVWRFSEAKGEPGEVTREAPGGDGQVVDVRGP
jgi:hypothetical protein